MGDLGHTMETHLKVITPDTRLLKVTTDNNMEMTENTKHWCAEL